MKIFNKNVFCTINSKTLNFSLIGILALSAASPIVHADDAFRSIASSPLIILSEKIGDVGSEAITLGLPADRVNKFLNSGNDELFDARKGGIIYVDVDSIKDTEYREVFSMVHRTLQMGQLAVIETSMWNFEKMHGIVAAEFPKIDPSTVEDVAVILYSEGGSTKAIRIGPNDLARYGGVDVKDRNAEISTKFYSRQGKTLDETDRLMHAFAEQAYQNSVSSFLGYDLKWASSEYVRIWKNGAPNILGNFCIVSWRGTVPALTAPQDLFTDVASQFGLNRRIPTEETSDLYGGRGFVTRLENLYERVNNKLESENCAYIFTTGHSLGAAMAQLHAIQLAYHLTLKNKITGVYGFNSPNVVTSATRTAARARFNTDSIDININNRSNDAIVNSVPTGLVRLGTTSTSPRYCTHVAPEVSSWRFSNHGLALWYDDL